MTEPEPTLEPALPRILVVDDDEIDIMAIKRTLRRLDVPNPVSCAHDGIEALELLRGDAADGGLERPYIILLDLNMPRMSGLEFLRELRSDDALRDSVVFVFTTSNAEEDKAAAYALNVAGYMLKTDGTEQFSNCLLYTSPSPRDRTRSRMPSSA